MMDDIRQASTGGPDFTPARWPLYWYFITDFYCPQCGKTRRFQERRYSPKPERWEERHEEVEAWDYCD